MANNLGAYNWQRVQIGSTSFSTYEVDCYTTSGSGTFKHATPANYPALSANPSSLEACMAFCSSQNTGSTPVCLGVAWDNTANAAGNCNLANQGSVIQQNPPSFSAYTAVARLLNPSTTSITDQFYLLTYGTAGNLGLCSNGAYAYTMIAPQSSTGVYVAGTSSSNGGRLYEMECGRQFVGGGVIGTPAATSTLEDCLRACDSQNFNVATGSTNICQYFQWDSVAGTCTIYNTMTGYPSSPSTTSTVHSGIYLQYTYNSANGYPSDRPSTFGYKRGLENTADVHHIDFRPYAAQAFNSTAGQGMGYGGF